MLRPEPQNRAGAAPRMKRDQQITALIIVTIHELRLMSQAREDACIAACGYGIAASGRIGRGRDDYDFHGDRLTMAVERSGRKCAGSASSCRPVGVVPGLDGAGAKTCPHITAVGRVE